MTASVANRKRVERILRERLLASNFTGVAHEPVRTQIVDQWVDVLTGALLADGVFHDEVDVKAAAAEMAEKIAEIAEEAADELDLPVMAEWLDQRDWFKTQLHALAALARRAGESS